MKESQRKLIEKLTIGCILYEGENIGQTLEARSGNQLPGAPDSAKPTEGQPAGTSPVAKYRKPVSLELTEMLAKIEDTAGAMKPLPPSPNAIQHDAQVFVGERLSRKFGNKPDATRNKGVVIKIPAPAGQG